MLPLELNGAIGSSVTPAIQGSFLDSGVYRGEGGDYLPGGIARRADL